MLGATVLRCATALPKHAVRVLLEPASAHAQDEEAELLAELARIKREREEEAAKRAAEEAAAAASNLQEELIRGNPLIIGKFDKATDFQVSVRCPLPHARQCCTGVISWLGAARCGSAVTLRGTIILPCR